MSDVGAEVAGFTPLADAATTRRLHAGLSPALLSHAATGQNFLGFISYRRRDGLVLAKWLRDRITGFQPPAELKAKIDAIDASVGGKQNRVFFDMSYQRPNVDFWDEHIAASLCRSRTLILLQTPSVFEKLDDGEPNWCEREIETYLNYYGEPSRILVVMAPGAPIDRFPEPLAKISARWDWIDLRFFSESPLQRFRHSGQYDPLLIKILAKIYDIADGELPLLNREFAKGRARVRRALAVAACTAIVSLSALTGWALMERDRATGAEKTAVEQRDAAIRQRNAALVAQSRFLAKAADEQSTAGSARAAVAILREALPDPASGRERPLVSEAVASSYRAIYDDREKGRLPMPAGATAVVSDGEVGRNVVATPDKLIVRHGLDPAALQEWPHDFGAVQSMSLSPTGGRVVMMGASGALMVRDLADNRQVLRDDGMGRGTTARFIHGGAKLLVANADQTKLQLVDLDGGAAVTTRTFATSATSFADEDYLAVVADATLMRLSPDDLTTLASVAVPRMQEYAFALSPDRERLYLAAAQQLESGSVLALDATTLVVEQTFGRLSFGARFMAASPTHNFLALNGASGVDFFNTKTLQPMGHVSSMPLTGGRFVKDSFYYIGFNAFGDIQQFAPELLTTTGYKTIDGGGIIQIDPLADNSGFLSVSDRPSITQWSYDTNISSRKMTMPFMLRNIDTKIALTIGASDFDQTDDTVVASYANGAIRRWNVNDGTSKAVKDAENQPSGGLPQLAALDHGVTLVAQPSGLMQIFSEAGGSAAPVSALDVGVPSVLVAVAPATAFVVVKGVPSLLDVSDPTKPSLKPLDAFGSCPGAGGGIGVAVCLDDKGHLKVFSPSDNAMIADLPPPAGGFNAGLATAGGKEIVTADVKGNVVWRSGPDRAIVRQWETKGTLRDKLLARWLARGVLSQAQAAAVRAGATSVEVPMSPERFEATKDGTRVAAVLPNGAIKLIARDNDTVIDIPARTDRLVGALKFSPQGRFLAVVDHVEGKWARAMMVVYDTATGQRMFAFNVDPEVVPKLHVLSNGRGFVTVNTIGSILVHPVYDNTADLIAYLAAKFPIPLTPPQRRFFFIE